MEQEQTFQPHSIEEKLSFSLDSHLKDLAFAINQEPMSDCLPEVEEEAVSLQIALVAGRLAARTGVDWLELVRSRIVQKVNENSGANPRMLESVFFTNDFDEGSDIFLKIAMDSAKRVGIPEYLDFDEAVARGRARTESYRDATRLIHLSGADIDEELED